ncbi:hypothetical protein CMI45_00325 [Candidatus Pacearchaeota archaeon]|nr:hypothetical protein [Candidatus Pacearchaeota archaeon]|tara:strand:- start:7989 stop:8792 length:804 start_codon:yes stop_codon:yes gene_type:complete
MKRVGVLLLMTLVFSMFAVSVVSAADNPFSQVGELTNSAVESFVDVIEPLSKVIVGTSETGEIFFGRLLMLVVVFSLVVVILGRLPFFDDHSWAPWLISGVLAITAVRFLSVEWIRTVVLPNQVFAVALTAGLPFVLFFLIVKEFPSRTARRVSWIFFGIVFLALWTARSAELGKISYVYPLTALLALGMIFFDGTIRRWMAQIEMENLGAASNVQARANLQTKINEVNQRMLTADPAHPERGTLTAAEGNKLLKGYSKQMKKLLKG